MDHAWMYLCWSWHSGCHLKYKAQAIINYPSFMHFAFSCCCYPKQCLWSTWACSIYATSFTMAVFSFSYWQICMVLWCHYSSYIDSRLSDFATYYESTSWSDELCVCIGNNLHVLKVKMTCLLDTASGACCVIFMLRSPVPTWYHWQYASFDLIIWCYYW